MKCHHRKLEYSTLSGPQSNRERDLSPWLTVCGYPKDFWLMCSDRTLHAPQFTCYRCYVQMCWLKQHVQTQNGRAGELIEQKDKEGMKTNDICFILYIPLIIKHSTTLLKSMQAEIYTQSTAGFWNVLSLFILCKSELCLLFSSYCVRLKNTHCDPKRPYGKGSILPIPRALIQPTAASYETILL